MPKEFFVYFVYFYALYNMKEINFSVWKLLNFNACGRKKSSKSVNHFKFYRKWFPLK